MEPTTSAKPLRPPTASISCQAPWFEHTKKILAIGVVQRVPFGEWCLRCGTVAESFPLMTKAEVITALKESATLTQKFEAAALIFDGPTKRNFVPQAVGSGIFALTRGRG